LKPGGQDTPYTTLYLVTQENCINCPAAKAIVKEATEGTNIPVEIVDLPSMDPDFEFQLLENQVFIASTPTIIIERGGNLRILTSGKVPTIESIQEALRGQ
jgi:hypothetical protein